MDRVPVKSSNIVAIGYDPHRSTLEVEFKHGGVYQYRGFPKEAAEAFIKAESKGKHFHRYIKPRYQGELIAPTRPDPANPGRGPATSE